MSGGQRSRSHKTKDKLRGLAETSFLIPLCRAGVLDSKGIIHISYCKSCSTSWNKWRSKTYEKKFSKTKNGTASDVSVGCSGCRFVHEHCYADGDHHHKHVLDTTISFPRPNHTQNHNWYRLCWLSQHLPAQLWQRIHQNKSTGPNWSLSTGSKDACPINRLQQKPLNAFIFLLLLCKNHAKLYEKIICNV